MKSLQEEIYRMGKNAKEASKSIAIASPEKKNGVLISLASLLRGRSCEILIENARDIENAHKNNMDTVRIERLRLTEKSIDDIADACLFVAKLADPIGSIKEQKKQDNGLLVGKMQIPLGVIAMIYESRPNVTIDAAILCLKAGNAVLLRGGSEAFHTNMIFASLLQKALQDNELPEEVVQFIKSTDRQSIYYLCELDEFIDVIIPRGGEKMVQEITQKACMPVLKHDKGVTHAFIDESADLEKALAIIQNGKVQKPAVCNALEGVLVHKNIAKTFLPMLFKFLENNKVTLHACEKSLAILSNKTTQNSTNGTNVKALDENYKGYEFLNLEMVLYIVEDFDHALDYIHNYGSHHTEIICTNNHANAQRFLREVDASMVAVNASTRFNDGGQLGLGAEIGICTSKLHAYGPMGIEELTATKFVVLGDGQIRI